MVVRVSKKSGAVRKMADMRDGIGRSGLAGAMYDGRIIARWD